MKKLLSSVCVATCLVQAALVPAYAQNVSADISAVSALSSAAVIVSGGIAISAAGEMVVISVTATAAGTSIVLESLVDGSVTTLLFASDVVEGSLLVAGTTVSVVAVATGYLLVSGGLVLAHVATDAGTRLVMHEEY